MDLYIPTYLGQGYKKVGSPEYLNYVFTLSCLLYLVIWQRMPDFAKWVHSISRSQNSMITAALQNHHCGMLSQQRGIEMPHPRHFYIIMRKTGTASTGQWSLNAQPLLNVFSNPSIEHPVLFPSYPTWWIVVWNRRRSHHSHCSTMKPRSGFLAATFWRCLTLTLEKQYMSPSDRRSNTSTVRSLPPLLSASFGVPSL